MYPIPWFNFFVVLFLLLVVLRYGFRSSRIGLAAATISYVVVFFAVIAMKSLTYPYPK